MGGQILTEHRIVAWLEKKKNAYCTFIFRFFSIRVAEEFRTSSDFRAFEDRLFAVALEAERWYI